MDELISKFRVIPEWHLNSIEEDIACLLQLIDGKLDENKWFYMSSCLELINRN